MGDLGAGITGPRTPLSVLAAPARFPPGWTGCYRRRDRFGARVGSASGGPISHPSALELPGWSTSPVRLPGPLVVWGLRVRGGPFVVSGPAADPSGTGSFTHTTTNWRTYQHRTANQRPHSRTRGPARRTGRGAGRHRQDRDGPAACPRLRARPGGGGPDGPPTGRQAHGLRQVQVRERPEGPRE